MQSTLERELNVPETAVRKACGACVNAGYDRWLGGMRRLNDRFAGAYKKRE
jgi:hypothetical protein